MGSLTVAIAALAALLPITNPLGGLAVFGGLIRGVSLGSVFGSFSFRSLIGLGSRLLGGRLCCFLGRSLGFGSFGLGGFGGLGFGGFGRL